MKNAAGQADIQPNMAAMAIASIGAPASQAARFRMRMLRRGGLAKAGGYPFGLSSLASRKSSAAHALQIRYRFVWSDDSGVR
jgi:hypothetical protein